MSVTLYPASIKFNDNGTYKPISSIIVPNIKLVFTDISVPSSSFSSDSSYIDYPYSAQVSLPSVESSMIPEVTFGITDVSSFTFAPIAASYDGGIYLYANKVPNDTITIPTIVCWFS